MLTRKKYSLSLIPLCTLYQKGKIQGNTQGHHSIVNKGYDLHGLNHFKIKCKVLLLLKYSSLLQLLTLNVLNFIYLYFLCLQFLTFIHLSIHAFIQPKIE